MLLLEEKLLAGTENELLSAINAGQSSITEFHLHVLVQSRMVNFAGAG
jgi:hypothetical protein